MTSLSSGGKDPCWLGRKVTDAHNRFHARDGWKAADLVLLKATAAVQRIPGRELCVPRLQEHWRRTRICEKTRTPGHSGRGPNCGQRICRPAGLTGTVQPSYSVPSPEVEYTNYLFKSCLLPVTKRSTTCLSH